MNLNIEIMGNCLVTKLKGSVDDFNLPLLGEFRFRVHKVDGTVRPTIVLGIQTGTVVRTDGNHKLYVDGDSTGVTSFETTKTDQYQQYSIQCDNDDYDFIVEDRTKIKYINKPQTSTGVNIGYDVSNFQYCTSLAAFNWQNTVYVTGRFIPCTTVAYYNVTLDSLPNVVVDADSLSTWESSTITTLNFSRCNAYGSLNSLVNICKATTLTRVYFSGTDIQGELDDFLPLVAARRTSGTLAISYGSSKITKGGVAGTTINVRFGSSMVNPTEQETAQGWQIA